MSLNAAALKLLAAKGLTADEIVELAEALESGVKKSSGAARQARYRENKRAKSVTGDVTNDVTGDVTPPPIDNIIPPSSEANASGAEPPADLKKQVFDLGLSLVMLSGKTEKEARSLVGMWRKGRKDGEVLAAFLECQSQDISSPLEWLQKRFQAARWVSKSGYEYRGSDADVLREAERRGDNDTYWAVKAALGREAKAQPKRQHGRGSSVPIGNLVEIAMSASA